jgi:hypothetical protein
MPLKSAPLAGFLRQAESLCVPNSMIARPNMPKISAYCRHCSRFLENRRGDLVRLHCVTELQLTIRLISSAYRRPYCQVEYHLLRQTAPSTRSTATAGTVLRWLFFSGALDSGAE